MKGFGPHPYFAVRSGCMTGCETCPGGHGGPKECTCADAIAQAINDANIAEIKLKL